MSYEMQACGDKVIARPVPIENITKGGIVLPGEAADRFPQVISTVISVGKDVEEVKVGDTVMSHKNSGMIIAFDADEMFKIYKQDEIYAILK